MKKLICTMALVALSTICAQAKTIGVSMANISGFTGVLRDGMVAAAAKSGGVYIIVEDANGDQAKQLQTLKDFVAKKVDAIIVVPIDGDQGIGMSKIATDAGIPLIFVNNEPKHINNLPAKEAYVGSDERESGTLQVAEICRLLGGKGKIAVMTGELLHFAARQRTQDVMDFLAQGKCPGVSIVEMQSANWSGEQASELVKEWLSAGVIPDAIIANNDGMALGVIGALSEAGVPKGKVMVAGVDAMPDALAAVKNGDMTLTVLQSAVGQGAEAVNAGLKLADGETVASKIFVPFELVTKENVDSYLAKK